MKKNNNIFIVFFAALVVITVGLIVYSGGRNKSSAPALDQHGHPIASSASVSAALFNPDKLINQQAPDFALSDQSGKTYSLNELLGKNIILFFNEGLMCYPACWNQIVALAQDERLNQDDTVVLSVVADPSAEWQKAIDKMPELAEATVVFDKNAVISKEFGVLTAESSMHYGSLPGHTFMLIDKEGIIKHIFDDPNMGLHNDQLVVELGKLN